MFTWKRNWTLPRPITVGGTPIELSDSAKFLGVTLDAKLNFNQHIVNISKKSTAALMQCKRAVGPTWGLTPETCKWIYTKVIRPMLSYSSVIWINALNKKHNITKLQRVQALALRIVSGAMPSTNFEALDHLTDTSNIISYLKGEAAKGAARLKAYGEWTGETTASSKGTIMAHTTINNAYINSLSLPEGKCDLTKPIYNINSSYIIDLPNTDNLLEYRTNITKEIKNINTDTITCYTDGSKTEEGTGF